MAVQEAGYKRRWMASRDGTAATMAAAATVWSFVSRHGCSTFNVQVVLVKDGSAYVLLFVVLFFFRFGCRCVIRLILRALTNNQLADLHLFPPTLPCQKDPTNATDAHKDDVTHGDVCIAYKIPRGQE